MRNVIALYFRAQRLTRCAQRRRWIDRVEVFGHAAHVRVVLDYPAVTYVDFFALLKIDGEWNIVSKGTRRKQRCAPRPEGERVVPLRARIGPQ